MNDKELLQNLSRETLIEEVSRLRSQQSGWRSDKKKFDEQRAEVERLQKVVAEQALTIGTLKDELASWKHDALHERDAKDRVSAENDELVKQAQTARLALDVADKEVEAQRASKDRAYKERNALVAALSQIFPAHLMRHPEDDASWERDWMWIVCIHAPVAGQMTWHLHDSDLAMFSHLREAPNHWDGHSTEEKYERLAHAHAGVDLKRITEPGAAT